MFSATPGGGGRVAESVKARIRRGSLLRDDDYKRLLEFSSVGDIAVYLGKSAYGPALKDFSLEQMRRSDLEFIMSSAVLADGVAFRHYGGLGDRKLLDLWLEYFDITLFKNHTRQRLGASEWGNSDDRSDSLLDMVSDFRLTMVDREKLLSGSNLKDIIMSVRNEDLRTALFEAVPGRENMSSGSAAFASAAEFQRASFNIGMILERHYFNNLYAAVSGIGGTEGRLLRSLIGTRVDLINIYWIYRARRFFNMSPEEALTLIIKARYHADFKLLTRVAFAEPSAVMAALAGTAYADVFQVESTEAAFREVEIECRIYRALFYAAQKIFLSGSQGFQNVAAYLILKELEIRDVIAIVESVRYGFDKSKTNLLLVRPLGKVS